MKILSVSRSRREISIKTMVISKQQSDLSTHSQLRLVNSNSNTTMIAIRSQGRAQNEALQTSITQRIVTTLNSARIGTVNQPNSLSQSSRIKTQSTPHRNPGSKPKRTKPVTIVASETAPFLTSFLKSTAARIFSSIRQSKPAGNPGSIPLQ